MTRRESSVVAEQTGQPLEKIEDDTRRTFWLSAEEAKKYGIVGKIIKEQKELVGKKWRG